MNEIIETAFTGFKVNNVDIPVKYLHYEGHGEPYVVYTPTDNGDVFSAEDHIQNYNTYYDFDIYSKGNYLAIVEAVKEKMKNNGFTWQPSRDSRDMYEDDTGYYHKTLCFAIERGNE